MNAVKKSLRTINIYIYKINNYHLSDILNMPYKKKSNPKPTIKKMVAKAKKSNLVKLIKKTVAVVAETKTACNLTVADQNVVVSGGLNNVSALGFTSGLALPSIPQGATDGQRIGNSIYVKTATLKYTLRAIDVSAALGNNPYPALPFLIRLVAYSHRLDKSSNSNVGLLETGSGSTQLGGTPDTWIEPYNRKDFVIHASRQFLMQPIRSNYTTAYASDNVAANSKSFIFGKLKLKNIPKKWIYNDALMSNTPTNVGLYIGVAVCNVDGTAIASNHNRAMINLETYITYNDL